MKKFTIICLTVFGVLQVQAKVWRVNNISGVDADFSDLQPAINAAAAGDTIMVEASAVSYGNITVNKRLVLIGPGYFLTDATPNPKTEADKNNATLGDVRFNPGSEGSVFEGFVVFNQVIHVNAGSITIQRNFTTWTINVADATDVVCNDDTIRQNVLGVLSFGSQGNNSVGNLIVYNNIFTRNVAGATVNLNNIKVSGFFINNIFNSMSTSCVNFVFQNNIFIGGSVLQPSNSFFNNLSTGTIIPTGDGNQQNVDQSTLFVGFPDGTGFSSDGRFKLAVGSLAINAGLLGATVVDCGVFGGPAPYVLSGMPSIPSIYSLTVPTSAPSGSPTMNISISSTTVH